MLSHLVRVHNFLFPMLPMLHYFLSMLYGENTVPYYYYYSNVHISL